MWTFLDSNIFLYASGTEHPLREPCREVLRQAAAGQLDATTSSEVVQELLYVLTRRKCGNKGRTLAKLVLSLFPDILPVSGDDMQLAVDLLDRHQELPVRDAVHAAVMLNHRIPQIISADRHFDQVPEITRIDPTSALF
jgi:uncharacterized protein